MKIAIITGASSGLGKEFFKVISARYPDLDEIWLIARRAGRLAEMRSENVTVRPVPLDLTKEESIDELKNMLSVEKADVRILVNNAGCGVLGNISEADAKAQANMVDVNVRALTTVTTVVLPHMSEGSYIINVSSIASFVPNARMTVYSSTKAYVTSFSKALRYELKMQKKGINCLVVCPGPMRTEFLPVAGINGNSKAFEVLPYCDPVTVAEKSVKRAESGKGFYTPRFFFKFYRVVAKILPHNWLMGMAKT